MIYGPLKYEGPNFDRSVKPEYSHDFVAQAVDDFDGDESA